MEELKMYISKKKSICKGYILFDSNFMTFWKKQNCGDGKKDQYSQGVGARGRDE